MMKEIRNGDNLSAISESRTIEGYGVVFNSLSQDLGGFKEIIKPSAITDETIRKSDILFLLDHNKERGILARSKNGNGSLKISVDERGVKYSFDAPHTALGDEVLEGLNRGDISKCSFAFTVGEDRWEKQSDGTILRTIDSINQLYDISIVYNPAYEETIVVNKRGLEEMEEKEKEEMEELKSECENQENRNDDVDESKEEKEESSENVESNDEPSESKNEDESDEKDSEESDDEENTEKEDRNLNLNNTNTNHNIMNQKFSLINTINDTINRRSNEFVNGNTISLPLEMRAEGDGAETPAVPNGILAGVETQGKEVIDNKLWDLMTDLKDKLVLSELGAQFITANSTIEIPRYSGEQAAWLGETDHSVDVAGKFSSIKIAPKRLSAYLDISNTWLEMNSANAEAVLRDEISRCIAEKLQKTILGNGKGSDNEPQGLFYNVTADTADFTYADAVAMEETLESNNVYSTIKYCVNPSAKSKLRVQPIDKGSGRFVMEGNEILGIPALSTNSMVSKAILLGDFSQLVICSFGNVRFTVDTLTRAVYNQTRLVVNLDVNYAVKREEAFVRRIMK